MKKFESYAFKAISLCCLLILTGCPPKSFVPNLADTTPPVFDRLEIQLLSGGDVTSPIVERFNIATSDAARADIEPTLQIGFNISATDNESGIKSIMLDTSPNSVTGFPF